MKKKGLLSITEWSQARRLSVCINNKSQRRHSLHEREVAAHSSSVDDGSNADSKISLCTVAQSQFSFLSLPSKALSPWHQVTKGWCEISPFWIGTSLWRRLCHQNLPGAYLAYICWWSVLQYNLGPMSLNKDMTYLTHCSHLGIFCGVNEKGKDYPFFHPSIHPLYPLLPALWVAGSCWSLSLAVIGRRRKSKMQTINGWNRIELRQHNVFHNFHGFKYPTFVSFFGHLSGILSRGKSLTPLSLKCGPEISEFEGRVSSHTSPSPSSTPLRIGAPQPFTGGLGPRD